MSVSYGTVAAALRQAYDGSAAEREQGEKQVWKLEERAAFLARVQAEGKHRLLEIGAGPGHDSLFFQQNGLEVVATDLSPEMVRHCRAKGLEAHGMDFLSLDFPDATFEAVYALNCLLHVPNEALPQVLGTIHRLLVPGGLFYLGVYGGEVYEGIAPDDSHDPPRFFSWRSDEQLQAIVQPLFQIVDFHVLSEGTRRRFQSLTLRRGPAGSPPIEQEPPR